jgi:hypothetical protein
MIILEGLHMFATGEKYIHTDISGQNTCTEIEKKGYQIYFEFLSTRKNE